MNLAFTFSCYFQLIFLCAEQGCHTYIQEPQEFESCFKFLNLNGNIVSEIREIAEMDYLAIWRVLNESVMTRKLCEVMSSAQFCSDLNFQTLFKTDN